MYVFHVTIHAQGGKSFATAPQKLKDCEWQTLAISPAAVPEVRFGCSFESAIEQLSQLDRMYCEPDGSFVWVSAQGVPPWQVDGNLYDRDDRLIFVDLKGACPAVEFDRLLNCLGWPETPVVFQLVREAVWLDEPEFRRWASYLS
jgi:hypothetical protein